MAPRAKGAVMNHVVVMPNETAIATTATVFALTVNPDPARQSRTIPPKKRFDTNQLSKRSDDLEKRKAASRIGPVVGMTGTTIPMKATPTHSQPKAMSTLRRIGFLTTVTMTRVERTFPDSLSEVRSVHARLGQKPVLAARR